MRGKYGAALVQKSMMGEHCCTQANRVSMKHLPAEQGLCSKRKNNGSSSRAWLRKLFQIIFTLKPFHAKDYKMQCVKCGTPFRNGVVLEGLNGKPRHTGFCCYSCYLSFWQGNKLFEPLPCVAK